MVPAAAAIPAALKALMASKYFWPLLFGGTYLGSEGLKQVGQMGERGVAREQIALQKLIGEQQAEASKRVVTESRRRAKEYTETLLKEKRGERQEVREQDLINMFVQGQDRRMMMLMQAIQGISQARPSYSPAMSQSGMLGLMRSNL